MTPEEKEAFNFKPKEDLFVEKLTDDEIKVLKRLEDSTQDEKEAYYRDLPTEDKAKFEALE